MEAVTPETVVVEVLDSHGRVRARERMVLSADRPGFTVGRSTAADVILDDAFVAPLHVSIEITPERRLCATDLGSVNGIVVKSKRHKNAQRLELPDGLLRVGRTYLRLRTQQEDLAAEKPDHFATYSHAGRIAYPAALVCVLFIAYYTWLAAPWDPAAEIAYSMIKVLPVVGAWIALWALVSRVMTGEWRGTLHAAILLGVLAVLFALDFLMELTWFSLALPQWSWRNSVMLGAAFAVALYWHLAEVSTLKRRTVALTAVLLPLLAVGATTWVSMRGQERNVNFIDADMKVYPPALRLREGGTVDEYFAAAAGLKEAAERRRKAVPEGEDPEQE